ncbi:MAG: peptidoglycan bridge formation glycyltransferase FemA/FemB family protein [Patescibacteria group bacterium]
MSVEFQDPSYEQWQQALLAFSEVNFLNSWEYGESQAGADEPVIRRITTNGHVMIQAVVRAARRGRYLEIAGGPLLDWSDQQLIEIAVEEIRRIAVVHNCVYVRIRPQVTSTDELLGHMKSTGFRLSQMHLNAQDTSMIDLSQSEDQLLANMRKKTRYEVRQAEKKNVVVSIDSSLDSYDQFLNLQIETAQRQNYVIGSTETLKSEYEHFMNGGMVAIYHAHADGVLLASAMIVSFGEEACYLYGASTPEGRNLPGAYAIQWRAIRDVKVAGKKRYNLWGIAPEGSENHRYAGVTTFKKGFGGSDYTYVPAHDLVIDKLRYQKNLLVETVRRKRRGL